MKKILKLKYGVIHKLIYIASVPLIDFEEFMIRIKDMPGMILKTRSALKNDDWDASYIDKFALTAAQAEEKQKVLNFRDKKDQMDAEKISLRNAEMAEKEKRRKAHFFHGRINFPQ